ncbi:von Willebrand factor A domain-containing protein 5B1 isoform X2 [Octodon degus]|uniref:von Willebrand factor A domain-containing protein 5B1 isoform X2 n=1 Tax=Octodon degus TaxID=10160 RepID=A0A6P6F2E2_OCTDE|nr:von Willebrand factor A domain-containing protein 5B1 isoform X2 [Octodon degus]
MPGLLNRVTGAALPLTASDVTSFVSGYALGLTASLTYGNLEAQPFQGLFVYVLDEFTTVIGFEAVIADRIVKVQIKDKAKLESSHLDASCARSPTVTGDIRQEGVSIAPHSCTPGKVALDEDLERVLFVVNLGTITPMENVTVFISTSSELPTLPSGAVRVLLPAICAPTVPQFCTKSSGLSNPQAQGKDTLPYYGTQALDSWNKLCLATLLDPEVTNPMEYDFNFQLEIHGPCLLAGVESPTHEIRADAAPSARSAKSIVITLANKHTFDRPVEILIHPSEPHLPHVLMEKGDMTLAEYDQHLRGRTDFIKATKKNSSAERKTAIIRKRLHKDILHHSVIMLNFCPDLQSMQPNLRKTHGEFIFLVDRSNGMRGTNIHHVKDAMLVALKSLMPTCLFNVIGFGSTFKTLFPSSQTYSEWIVRQPVHQGHPRLLFLITGGAIGNTGKVLELVRNHAFSTRCYSFGIGPKVCHRLVKGLASVSKGSAEFLVEGERLQPKMIKSLKKAMAPVLSDVTVEWVFPEATEVLIAPVSTSTLFPGERLVGYGIVCDASLYVSNPRSDKRRRYGMLHSQESGSSVFYHSQDEGAGPDSGDCTKGVGAPFSQGRVKDAWPLGGDPSTSHSHSLDHTPRRRAYSTNQITDHKLCPRATTASEPTGSSRRYPLRKAKLQDLTNQTSLEGQRWQNDLQTPKPVLNNGQDLSQGPKLHGPGARRPSLLPQGCQPFLPSGQETLAWSPMRELDPGSSLKSALDSRSPGDQEPSYRPSAFETETSSDWEPTAECEEQASPGRPSTTPGPVLGKALVKGLREGQRVQWEVSFELGPPGPEPGSVRDADLWSETFHHLAARAVIRDLEQLAEREDEIEQGSSCRYQVNAVHTSKACNVISKYTAFVPVDVSKNRYLPTAVEYPSSGVTHRMGSSGVLTRQWRGASAGFGRPQTTLGEDLAVGDGTVQTLTTEESPTSPFSELLSPSREKHTASEGPLHSLPTNTLSSTKASETLFGSKLNFNKSRLLTRAAKGFLGKPLTKAAESTSGTQSFDYVPLVSLQLASGAFLLNQAFCEAIHIPTEKLMRTSPFSCHRVSLSARPLCTGPSPPHLSCDSISLGPLAEGRPGSEPTALVEHTGKLWATVVGLAWLEHSSASYFIEWELVAAKANSWLEQQEVPEGHTQAVLKAAARQLFVLLRHWDENLEFNMLCYNPNYV